VATQKPEVRKQINVDQAAQRLTRFFGSSVELMKVMARACGHDHLNQFDIGDIGTWDKVMAELSGIRFTGVE
jgi:glutamate synthase domain-containing protein 2